MKKTLIATSALVAAAGSAAALDLSLNGNISITADIEVDQSGFDGADWDAGFTFKASGESMGWTYGGTMKFGMFNAIKDGDSDTDGFQLAAVGADNTVDAGDVNIMAMQLNSASAYMGGDFMGRIMVTENCGNFVNTIDAAVGMDAADEVGTISGHCANWTGLNVGGFELKAAMALDPTSEALIVGGEYLNPNLGKVDFEFDTINESWDAEVATVLEGTTIAIGMDYNNNEDNGDGDFDYVVSMKGSFGDITWGAAYSPHGAQSNDTLTRSVAGRKSVDGFTGYSAATLLPAYDAVTNPSLMGTGDFTYLGSGDGKKALGLSVGFDCYSLNLGIDAERTVDAQYEAMVAAGTLTTLTGLSAAAAAGALPLADGTTGAAIGDAQSFNANASEQGLISEWEFGMDCELHDGVTVTASLGAESSRSVELQKAAYVVSQVEAAHGNATTQMSPYKSLSDLNRSAAMQGKVGIKVTF